MCAVRKSRSLLLLPSTHPYSWIIKKNIDPISSFQPSRHTYDHQRIHIYFLLHLANNLNFSEVEWIAWQKKNVYTWIDKEEDDDEVQCAPFKRPHTSIAGLDARKRSESVFWPHAWWAHDLFFLMFVIFVHAHYSRCARTRAERETMFICMYVFLGVGQIKLISCAYIQEPRVFGEAPVCIVNALYARFGWVQYSGQMWFYFFVYFIVPGNAFWI